MPTKSKKSNEQIRALTNKIHLAGILAELEPAREGKGADGTPYISIKGAIQCHESDPAYTAYFSCFIKATTSKGEESKAYKKAKEWVKTAVPMTKNKKDPTFVDMIGSLTYNSYCGADGTLKEDFVYNISYINDFKDYCFDLDIEGLISDIIEVVDKDDNPTGQQQIILYSKDFFGNFLEFSNRMGRHKIIADAESTQYFDDVGYEEGRTATISCSRDKMEVTPKNQKKGFGRQPTTGGSSQMVWKVVGGDEALEEDDENALNRQQMKMLSAEQKANNEVIVGEGYKGTKNGNTTESRKGFKSSKKPVATAEDFAEIDDEDEDDMPF